MNICTGLFIVVVVVAAIATGVYLFARAVARAVARTIETASNIDVDTPEHRLQ